MRVCSQCKLRYYDSDRSTCAIDGAPLVDAPDPRIGSVLGGRYILEELIGEGGMASVYRARHTLVDRPFAVKILRGELARDPTLRERLRREGRSAAALTHPNIVEIYDFGTTDDGAPYLVMELLTNGKTIRHILREEGAPPLGLTIEIAIQIARGLARAHDFGVVHRDLKPENVFVLEAADGRTLVKIVDFGIARTHQDPHLTSLGEILGTPQYMAPERATSRDVGPSADLYSFGVMLYELVTGHLPF
ncbi:MAG: serine/threonine protein kinase, partial [Sandaracinaceae bacterium]|nr:serine/threonine protein kinase [Sandaracinaceae bacterium]